MFDISNIIQIIPELILFVGILAGLMLGVFSEKRTLYIYSIFVLFLSLGSALYLNTVNAENYHLLFSNFLHIASGSCLVRIFILTLAILLLAILSRAPESEHVNYFEFPILFLCSVLGSLVMCISNDLLILYLGLELQSLSLYILIAAKKDCVEASESSLKYFILGAVASSFLLIGIALAYGFCGSTNYTIVEKVLSNQIFGVETIGITLSLIFITIGFAFKLGLAPFHMWLPDVYGGANYSTIILIGILPKVAAMFALTQLLSYPLYGMLTHWKVIVLALAMMSLTWSAFAGLLQKNLKRLLAYSSIGNIGFLCLGLCCVTLHGVAASFYYLFLYTLTSLLFFALIIMARPKQLNVLSDLNGFAKTYPLFAFFLAALIFSFAGIPPLPGFFAKLAIINVLISEGYHYVAIAAVCLSVISVGYYLGILRAIYMDNEDAPAKTLNFKKSKLLIVLLVTVALGLAYTIMAPGFMHETTLKAAASLFGS